MNWLGMYTLCAKEVQRFMKVAGQTVTSPVITALLYLVVFQQVLADRVQVFEGVSYVAFLIPGLIMMSAIQNAFANSASSLTQSKINGNLVFILLPPLSPLEIFVAFTAAAILRALMVATVLYAAGWIFTPLPLAAPFHALLILLLASGCLAVMGLIAGILADKFEHMAAFQNYLIMPLSFLSGVFYSVQDLPPFWAQASLANPFFYMIDGLRYGFFAQSDASAWVGLLVVGGFFALLSTVALGMLHRGTKLRG
ncbi:MAG: ABC transporter permease [Oceanococcaceae bacterium]